jgi:RNA polymerase sigma-70 factor (ECF subfamily)
MDEVTDWALRAQGGDPLAEAAFVRCTQAEVWRFCAALVDRTVADDLTQETYLRAFRALPAYEARASARTWLLGIARRACADHLRTVIRRRRLEETLRARAVASLRSLGGADRSGLAGPSDGAAPGLGADPESAVTAADLLGRLDADRRSAFCLTQLIGLSYQEAAEVEGVPIGTIRSRVARAREDLITQLARAAAS